MALKWTLPLTEYFNRCKGGPCVELAIPPSGADFLKMWEAEHPGTLRACPSPYMDCFTFFY